MKKINGVDKVRKSMRLENGPPPPMLLVYPPLRMRTIFLKLLPWIIRIVHFNDRIMMLPGQSKDACQC
jgi:hypothetical protein